MNFSFLISQNTRFFVIKNVYGLKIEMINSKINTPLTQREFDILEGLYEGKTNRQLAESQFVSVNTVKTHIKNIYEKMNTHTRSETVALIHSLLH